MKVYSDDIRYEDFSSLKRYLRSLKDKRVITKMLEKRLYHDGVLDTVLPRREQTVIVSGTLIENDYVTIEWLDKTGYVHTKVISYMDDMPIEIKDFYRLREMRSMFGSAAIITSKKKTSIFGRIDYNQKASHVPVYVVPKGCIAYIGRISGWTKQDTELYLTYTDWYLGRISKDYLIRKGYTVIEDIIKIAPNTDVIIDSMPLIEIIVVETFNDSK